MNRMYIINDEHKQFIRNIHIIVAYLTFDITQRWCLNSIINKLISPFDENNVWIMSKLQLLNSIDVLVCSTT